MSNVIRVCLFQCWFKISISDGIYVCLFLSDFFFHFNRLFFFFRFPSDSIARSSKFSSINLDEHGLIFWQLTFDAFANKTVILWKRPSGSLNLQEWMFYYGFYYILSLSLSLYCLHRTRAQCLWLKLINGNYFILITNKQQIQYRICENDRIIFFDSSSFSYFFYWNKHGNRIESSKHIIQLKNRRNYAKEKRERGGGILITKIIMLIFDVLIENFPHGRFHSLSVGWMKENTHTAWF